MPFYFRFGIGPLRFSQRLGRTQAQKRATARQRAQAAQARAERREARELERRAIAAEQACMEERQRQREDHDARTHRYRVITCSVDAIKGGEFTLEAEGEDLNPMRIRLDAKSAVQFLSLKVGDIIQVTLAPGNTGLEEFRHISRADGAMPQFPVELTAADMQWLGLTTTRSKSGG